MPVRTVAEARKSADHSGVARIGIDDTSRAQRQTCVSAIHDLDGAAPSTTPHSPGRSCRRKERPARGHQELSAETVGEPHGAPAACCRQGLRDDKGDEGNLRAADKARGTPHITARIPSFGDRLSPAAGWGQVRAASRATLRSLSLLFRGPAGGSPSLLVICCGPSEQACRLT